MPFPDQDDVARAADALWRLEHKAAELVPVNLELLTATDADVRHEAVSACGRLGPLAKSSAKALEVATEDGQPAVRRAARQALELVE